MFKLSRPKADPPLAENCYIRLLFCIVFLFSCFLAANVAEAKTTVKKKPMKKAKVEKVVTINKQYQALKIAPVENSLSLVGGQAVTTTIKFMNIGSSTWKSYSWEWMGEGVNIADDSWESASKIFTSEVELPQGEILNRDFSWRAPEKAGDYHLRFQLYAGGRPVEGAGVAFDVTVTADAPADYQARVFDNGRALIDQPDIRIGLYKSDKPVEFSADYDYQIYLGPDTESEVLPAGEKATLSYKKGVYKIKSASVAITSTDYLRLAPVNADGHFILNNYKRTLKWKGQENFNTYRGILEYRYSPKSKLPYIINELPLEGYMAGIAEISDGVAIEYMKAVLVAARTYAFKNLVHTANGEMFDVFASTADQLYLGYNSEVSMPRVASAVADTYGQMVTYGGEPVSTPYFGHSAGYTLLRSKVWGGADQPWLIPVDCVYDKGRKLYGHGVGMSNADAAMHAQKDRWSYREILRYYYTGVEIEKVY